MKKSSISPSERISELFHPAILCYSFIQVSDETLNLDSLVKKIKRFPNQSGYEVHFTDHDVALFGKSSFNEQGISEFVEMNKYQLEKEVLGVESCFTVNDENVSLVSDYSPDLDRSFNLLAHVSEPIKKDKNYNFLSIFCSKTLNSNVLDQIETINDTPVKLVFDFDPSPELVLVMLFGKKGTTRISISDLMEDLFNETVTINGIDKYLGEVIRNVPDIIKNCPCLRATQKEVMLTPPVIWRSQSYAGQYTVMPFTPVNKFQYKKADPTSVQKMKIIEPVEQKKKVQKEELDIKYILNEFKKGQCDIEFTLAELFDYIKGELAIRGVIDIWDKETEDKIAKQVNAYLSRNATKRKGIDSPQYDEAFDQEYFAYIAEKFSRGDPAYYEYLQRYEKSTFEKMADSNDVYTFN